MTTSRPNSTKIRRAAFLYWRYETPHGWRMKCGGDDNYRAGAYCGGEIHPAIDKWIANHDSERAHDGSDEPPNVRPRCKACDSRETPKDLKFIAKGKRQSDSIYGVKQSSRPMPGSKRSGWKKTFSHGWVRRDET